MKLGKSAPPVASGIYKITNTINGKFYIGSAVSLRARRSEHMSELSRGRHKNKKIQRSWDKHGADAFVFTIVELVPLKTELIQREQHWMDTLHPWYNIAKIAGSQLGVKASKETLARMSAAQLGRRHTLESRAKMSAVQKGHLVSIEARKNMSVAQKGKTLSAETRAKIAAALLGGKRPKHTPEQSAKMSLIRRGKPGVKPSPEARARMSAAQAGRVAGPMPAEHKANISASLKGKNKPPRTAEHIANWKQSRQKSIERKKREAMCA